MTAHVALWHLPYSLYTIYTTHLANIINRHNWPPAPLLCHYSDKPENLPLLKTNADCVADIKKTHLDDPKQTSAVNVDKTEAMLTGTRYIYDLASISIGIIQLGDTFIPLSDSVKNLGRRHSRRNPRYEELHQHHLRQFCYYQPRRICSVRKYLTTGATAKLVTSLILSRLDYCNALLSGLPAKSTHSLQHIQNNLTQPAL